MRNYREEYDNCHSKPKQRKRNASRKRARRKLVKEKGESAMKGKDVDHIDRNANNNSRSNLRVVSKRKNRSSNG